MRHVSVKGPPRTSLLTWFLTLTEKPSLLQARISFMQCQIQRYTELVLVVLVNRGVSPEEVPGKHRDGGTAPPNVSDA